MKVRSHDDIRACWRTVRKMESSIAVNTGPVLFSLIPHSTGFARLPESLLLLFAVSVLESALVALRSARRFPCKTTKLHDMMLASRNLLPWQSFEEIDSLRLRRNAVAHDAVVLTDGECSKAIAAISKELLAWNVLDDDAQESYSIGLAPSPSTPNRDDA